MTALFGGSFNPIHNGHIGLAQWIVQNKYADRVWLIVSPHNPLKASPDLADEQLRLHWADMACKNIVGVSASDIEYTLPRPSYTWQTLTALRKKYPKEQFALVIGADNWMCFNHWARHEWILSNFPLLVYPRKGYDITEVPHGVTLMPAPLFPVSSTEIRNRIRAGKDASEFLPPNIYTDILRTKTYV